MERKNIWSAYTPEQIAELDNISTRYKSCLNEGKTERECVELSIRMAQEAGYRKFIMFLHYPPTSIYEQDSRFTRMAQEYGAETVVYSHCHGWRRYGDSIRGNWRGVEYRLVSSDYLEFMPARIR